MSAVGSGPGSRPRTRLSREARRELLVDAAAKAFEGRDPASVTFEEIAEAAGVSRALVYNYFGDRQGVLEAVCRRSSERLTARVTDALASTPGRREALRAAIRASLEFAHEDPAAYGFAVGSSAPMVPELTDEQLAELTTLFGDDDGAQVIARGVMVSLQAMVLHCVERGPHDLDRATEVIGAFLTGGFAGADELGYRVRPNWPVPS